MRRRVGSVSRPAISNITLRSISASPPPLTRPKLKLGLRIRPACTNSASETPNSAKETFRAALLSSAIWTADSGVSGADSKDCTCVLDCWLSFRVSFVKGLTCPIRSCVSRETSFKPPSGEKLAQPARNTTPNTVATRLGVGNDNRFMLFAFHVHLMALVRIARRRRLGVFLAFCTGRHFHRHVPLSAMLRATDDFLICLNPGPIWRCLGLPNRLNISKSRDIFQRRHRGIGICHRRSGASGLSGLCIDNRREANRCQKQ
ncbi:hypothetical protein SAMN05880566_108226 [Janthinobacterium sp. TND4EL3]|nr:hypothetical protein SAMN05880566_108226 [Janthinobacterium sp. TND4EL3]